MPRKNRTTFSQMPKEICVRLRIARKKAGYTQASAAAALEVAAATYCQWEQGYNSFWHRLYDLCDLFGVSSPWLLEGFPVDRRDTENIKNLKVALKLLMMDEDIRDRIEKVMHILIVAEKSIDKISSTYAEDPFV